MICDNIYKFFVIQIFFYCHKLIIYYIIIKQNCFEKKMAQCKDCKFYKTIDETKGNCFGHEVPATLDSGNCPTNSFQPR